MSFYLVKRKGWRYDFRWKGKRYTGSFYPTKSEAKQAEARRKEQLNNPKREGEIQTDMAFLDLLNKRLDHVKAYNSASHYRDHRYNCQRWARRWEGKMCSQITHAEVEEYILERSKVSAYTANQDLRYLRATFNYAKMRGFIAQNPTDGIAFFPVEKKEKYIPPIQDIEKVIAVADPETKDYLPGNQGDDGQGGRNQPADLARRASWKN